MQTNTNKRVQHLVWVLNLQVSNSFSSIAEKESPCAIRQTDGVYDSANFETGFD